MLVDVVCMRHLGTKLPADVVRDMAPLRGSLVIVTEPWREMWQPNSPHVPTSFARLTGAEIHDIKRDSRLLPELRDARVTKMVDDSFLIVGIERHGRELHSTTDMLQAWWCRLAAPHFQGP